ncbi:MULTISPECIES: condensation domain-containing protein [unclassified Bradyrhizobium]|uniref:condensation domain-containing protein n=1 Tax=unclassified Bradyrhizobium TaxID=2631580 RepID=UPI0028E67E8E|nr:MULTISPECIES: condensation domain-containing protein [unclassified Bradyrhizobium]
MTFKTDRSENESEEDVQPETFFALTTPQRSIWVDQALHPHRPIYNTGEIFRINGVINRECFIKAIQHVAKENDTLRLRFIEGGEVFQQVADGYEAELEWESFVEYPDPSATAETWVEQFFWRPIEPTEYPLFRFALAKVASDRFILVQKYHHLIADAIGRRFIAEKLAANYNYYIEGNAPPLELSPSYRLAKECENQYQRSTQYRLDRDYWISRLGHLPAPCVGNDLSVSQKVTSGRPHTRTLRLEAAAAAALNSVARSHGVSEFKVIIGIALVALSCLYDRLDIVVGIPVANRDSESAKKMAGLYATAMPFRIGLDLDANFAAMLVELNFKFAEDLRHSRFPVDHIEIDASRRRRRQGLFDVIINYVRCDYDLTLGPAQMHCDVSIGGFAVPWGIRVIKVSKSEPIKFIIEYDGGRVPHEDARQLQCGIDLLLSRMLELPGKSIDEVRTICGSAMSSTDNCAREVLPEMFVGRPPLRVATDRNDRDGVQLRVMQIWQKYFVDKEVSLDDEFFESGGTSLGGLLVIAECNKLFDVKLPVDILFEQLTPAQMATAIRSYRCHVRGGSFVKIREGSNAAPVLLLHPVGGTLICYRELVSRLEVGSAVYGFQASDVDADEDTPQTIGQLAQSYIDAASNALKSERYHLVGWSFGGVVAWEMARRMSERDRLASVTIIDSSAYPTIEYGDEFAALRAELDLDASSISSRGRLDFGSSIAPTSQFFATSPIVTEVELERMAKVVRRMRRLRSQHQNGYLRGNATLIRASETPANIIEEWKTIIDGQLTVVSIPATHYTILKSPHVERVAKIVDRALGGM